MLRAAPGELDGARFEQLAAEGQSQLEAGHPARAEIVLSEALGLWRGEALADFRFEGFAQGEIGRLQERHASVVADRVDARLALGRAEEVIPELEALIREQRVSERPRRLMLALHQAGRQATRWRPIRPHARAAEGQASSRRRLRELHQQILSQTRPRLRGAPDERPAGGSPTLDPTSSNRP
jgi:DNA-binding SARP family transcriptional activator